MARGASQPRAAQERQPVSMVTVTKATGDSKKQSKVKKNRDSGGQTQRSIVCLFMCVYTVHIR